MSDSMNSSGLFNTLAKVLFWCFVFGFLLLLLSFVILATAGDWVHQIHSKWFDVTRHEFDLICYCVLAIAKTYVVLFFLVPWAAIRLVLRGTAVKS